MNSNNRIRKRIPFWQKAALVIFGLSLALFFLEMGLRLGGFILISLQEHRNKISVQTKGAYRIMCLGESTTANQYPQVLEKILNQRNIGIKFSVIDKGLTGTDTKSIVSALEDDLDKYHPDMVITMMGINDWDRPELLKDNFESKNRCRIASLRVYKLIKLLWAHIIAKVEETGLHQSRAESPVPAVSQGLEGVTGREASLKCAITSLRAKRMLKAIEINPKNDRAYVEIGCYYQNQNNIVQAEQALKKAIEINPHNATAYLALGEIYRLKNDLGEADKFLRKAIEINPKNDAAYYELAWCYILDKNNPKAKLQLKKSIELNPNNDKLFETLGLLYSKEKDPRAEKYLKKAVTLNPHNDTATIALAEFYNKQGHFFQAQQVLVKAIELNPHHDRVDRLYAALALLCEDNGEEQVAGEYYKKLDIFRSKYYVLSTVSNYKRLKEILDKKMVLLVCVQYPMRSVRPLKNIFSGQKDIIFVDNESIFKEAARKEGYREYFKDMFAGDFGHCTDKGNALLAENIANVILKEAFGEYKTSIATFK